MSLLIAMRVGAWSSTIRIRSRLFFSSPPGVSDIEGTTSGAIGRFPPDKRVGYASAAYTKRATARPRPIVSDRCAAGVDFRRARAPDSVGIEDFVRPEVGLVFHGPAPGNPEAQVIMRDAQAGRGCDFAQRAERSEPPPRLTRIIIEVDAAER